MFFFYPISKQNYNICITNMLVGLNYNECQVIQAKWYIFYIHKSCLQNYRKFELSVASQLLINWPICILQIEFLFLQSDPCDCLCFQNVIQTTMDTGHNAPYPQPGYGHHVHVHLPYKPPSGQDNYIDPRRPLDQVTCFKVHRVKDRVV